MARIRTITVNGNDYTWYVRPYKKEDTLGNLLVIKDSENVEHKLFIVNTSIGPGVVKKKIKKHIIEGSYNGESLQQRRPKIPASSIVCANGRSNESNDGSHRLVQGTSEKLHESSIGGAPGKL